MNDELITELTSLRQFLKIVEAQSDISLTHQQIEDYFEMLVLVACTYEGYETLCWQVGEWLLLLADDKQNNYFENYGYAVISTALSQAIADGNLPLGLGWYISGFVPIDVEDDVMLDVLHHPAVQTSLKQSLSHHEFILKLELLDPLDEQLSNVLVKFLAYLHMFGLDPSTQLVWMMKLVRYLALENPARGLALDKVPSLIINASEQMKEYMGHEDFETASQVFGGILKIFEDYPELNSSDQDIFSIYNYGIQARAALSAQNVSPLFSEFEQSLSKEILRLLPSIYETKKNQFLNYGKVLFFYYHIQSLRKAQDFNSLIQFYTEHNTSVASLIRGNIELNRLYEVTKDYYDEALFRKTESELTRPELPFGVSIESTLDYCKKLPSYQVVLALKSIKERFSSNNLTSQAQSLMQMYTLLLLLFDMQEPEELVFTSDRISELINNLRANITGEFIELIPKVERLHLSVLDTLEEFIHWVTAAVSVTDFVLVRQNISRALESLRQQRTFLKNCGAGTRHLWHMLSDHWITILVSRQRAMSRQTLLKLSLQSEEILAHESSPLLIYIKNTGPGFAQDIRITLASSDISIQEPVIVTVPILKSGDEDQIRFFVKPRYDSRHCEVRILTRYLDSDSNPVINSENRSLIPKTLAQKIFPYNSPYVWGQPLSKDTRIFYGRKDVFDFIKTHFWGEERNKILALQGERRMGKTSILNQLGNRKVFGNSRVVFFDFQARYASVDSIQEFLYHFARRIKSEARLSANLLVDRSDFLIGHREYYEVFDEWLRRVEEELEQNDTQIVVVFDEFEKLLGRRFEDNVNVNVRLVEELLQYLRSVMLTHRRLNWVITGSWSLIAKQREYFSSLFGMALSYWIGYLKRDDALSLIQEPVQEYLSYDQDATERILQLTGGHPFHIQIMCDELFNRARQFNNRRVAVEDVNAIIDHTLSQVTETNFRIVWNSLNNSISRKVLATVAEAMQVPNNFVLKDEVLRFLFRRSPGQGEDSFYAVLDIEDGELMQRQLIEAHAVDPERVRVRSELLYRWLRKAKPLVTVLREER